MSVLKLIVTSNARLGFSIFSKPSYFCMWNFVSADEAQLALSAKTKFHIQKCNTCRDIEKQSRRIKFLQYYSRIPSPSMSMIDELRAPIDEHYPVFPVCCMLATYLYVYSIVLYTVGVLEY